MPNKHKHNPIRTMTYLPIEDHGIIGDLHTVALVGKNVRVGCLRKITIRL